MKWARWGAIVGLASAAAGCGGSSTDDVRGVVRQANSTRGPAKCELFSAHFLARAGSGSAGKGRAFCRRHASSLPTASVSVQSVSVKGDRGRAVVRVRNRTAVYYLVKEDGGWKIDSVSAG